jgi:hypothetical protein
VNDADNMKNIGNAKAHIVIFSQSINLMEEGYALIQNISRNGAWFSNLELPSHSLPITSFLVEFHIQECLLSGSRIICSMSRFSNPVRGKASNGVNTGQLSLGLRLDKILDKDQDKIRNYIKKEDKNGEQKNTQDN